MSATPDTEPLHAVAYLSTAVRVPTQQELDRLLEVSQTLNARDGISGALLHHDGTFLQYLEGPRDAVQAVFRRIKASPLHHGVIELLDEPLERRQLAGWYMGFAQAPASWMQLLSQAQWVSTVNGLRQDPVEPSPGVGLLLQFWSQARRLPEAGHSGFGPGPALA